MPVDHGLAILIFIGRLGDVWSTHFLTPTMVLEANPIARRYKRATFALGFLLCGVPYFDVNLGVMVAVPLLLVTASNLSRAWLGGVLGEQEMEALCLRAASRGKLGMAIGLVWGTAFFFALAATILWWLARDNAIAWHFAVGLALYGILFAFHSSLAFAALLAMVARPDRPPRRPARRCCLGHGAGKSPRPIDCGVRERNRQRLERRHVHLCPAHAGRAAMA
jgi:hypothetical protein